jgi:hypothetical protein
MTLPRRKLINNDKSFVQQLAGVALCFSPFSFASSFFNDFAEYKILFLHN